MPVLRHKSAWLISGTRPTKNGLPRREIEFAYSGLQQLTSVLLY
jgi:hypothetical protein